MLIPGVFSATKTIAVSPFIGKDIERARELADELNSRRNVLAGELAVADPDAVVERMKKRQSRRSWVIILIIMAFSIFGGFVERDVYALWPN